MTAQTILHVGIGNLHLPSPKKQNVCAFEILSIRKYYYDRRSIVKLSETSCRPIGDISEARVNEARVSIIGFRSGMSNSHDSPIGVPK